MTALFIKKVASDKLVVEISCLYMNRVCLIVVTLCWYPLCMKLYRSLNSQFD